MNLLLLFSLTICLPARSEDPKTERKYGGARQFPVTVSKVLNANTLKGDIDLGFGIVLKDCTLRLYYVKPQDPESKEGKDAKAFAEEWFKAQTLPLHLQVEQGHERDEENRIVCVIFPENPADPSDSLNMRLFNSMKAKIDTKP